MIDVEILFLSEQSTDGESDKNKLKANGTLNKTDNGYILSYTEPDSEMGNSKTDIIIHSKNHVEMKRSGLYETVFVIEEAKTHICPYKTPFGVMDMEITASKVTADISKNGGRILLNYRIESNSQIIGENSLIMYIKSI